MLVSKMLGATMVAGASQPEPQSHDAPYGSAIPTRRPERRPKRPSAAEVRVRRHRGSLFLERLRT